ncbi:INVS-like protein, partial [Mya arenaria]
GNVRLLKLVLSKGADCHQKDNEGQTALHLCTRHKSPKTALHWAASYGNLEHDSNIGIPDIEGKTPLHWAASSKDPEAVNCVKLILDTTPSVINWQDYEGRTALHLAVADGNIAVVKALVAVDNCNIVSLLLDNHADYSSSDQNGATPLHYAAQNNFDDTVEVFLSRATVTDETDVEGRSAFMWASGKGADGVVSMFIKHNVDIQQVDKNGGTALHAAALSGHASTVKHLLDHGALIDATDFMKHTPLFRACEMGHTDVVQTLIDDGARVDMVDEDGRSPLHWAALGGHAYICQTLIKYVEPQFSVLHMEGMSIGMTALHWSCSKGHLDAVKLLIEYRTFPNHMEFTEDRGYRVRKTFKENKRLLMKHEQLKKEAARKRATEEFRKKEDSKHRREVEDRLRKTSLLGGSAKSKTEPDKSRREHPR